MLAIISCSVLHTSEGSARVATYGSTNQSRTAYSTRTAPSHRPARQHTYEHSKLDNVSCNHPIVPAMYVSDARRLANCRLISTSAMPPHRLLHATCCPIHALAHARRHAQRYAPCPSQRCTDHRACCSQLYGMPLTAAAGTAPLRQTQPRPGRRAPAPATAPPDAASAASPAAASAVAAAVAAAATRPAATAGPARC